MGLESRRLQLSVAIVQAFYRGLWEGSRISVTLSLLIPLPCILCMHLTSLSSTRTSTLLPWVLRDFFDPLVCPGDLLLGCIMIAVSTILLLWYPAQFTCTFSCPTWLHVYYY
ncbi:hypothetical protein BO82DRAFT_81347 [Aspergillus uvarum CBS 121591]|uniref:Uncharacterized protein n=1 Tax=Aspergillus uvarum CBS 121591 TaxID=1448315 RepID=A0A319CS24_9EURO|nr:hypothetical protein BO82DRAFT_81347 [Aspergillus uvarum CBS 121591]PYH81533.1 hypothetical protein BO82DRAFT_81347 [Aspergillus uvarum CBS 121591]